MCRIRYRNEGEPWSPWKRLKCYKDPPSIFRSSKRCSGGCRVEATYYGVPLCPKHPLTKEDRARLRKMASVGLSYA